MSVFDTSNNEPLFPEVQVNLVGEDGNAFSIMARVQRAMRSNGIDKHVIDCFLNECTSGDYDNLLITCMKYVDTSGYDKNFDCEDQVNNDEEKKSIANSISF